MRASLRVLFVVCLAAMPAVAAAQPVLPTGGPPQPLTLDQALQYALDHYPAVRAAVEQVNASLADVDVAHATYLPRLDSLWQSNLGTANNVFGQVLPQSVIPSLTGPVLSSASSQAVWGSATGALLSWEAYDFGRRHTGVTGAEAAVTRAKAGEALTRLEVQRAVANAYLGLLAAQQAVTAAQADFERRDVLHRSVQTLVDNQLRPGAEASRAAAERAAAQMRLVQAQQAVVLSQALLTRVLGVTSGAVGIAGDALMTRVPPSDLPAAAATAHPIAQAHHAAVEQARAAEDALGRTDLPRIYLQSSIFARGSGANPNGALDGGPGGLGLDRANWAAGVQIVFPNVFDFSSLRARKAAAAASTRSESALYDEALLTVTGEQQTSAALVQAARAVAEISPVQLDAARQSESQARARYDAGLASIVEVADAQGLLAQAEVQDRLARVDVWRALLAEAVARGDVASFALLVRQP